MFGPRHVEVPRLLRIGPDATEDLGRLLLDDFDVSDVVVVTGVESSKDLGHRFITQLPNDSAVRQVNGPAGTTASATDLLHLLDDRPATLVVAFGGGRPIDVAKLAASRARVDLIAVPTVLSHDGMCSPVVSLVAADGRRRSVAATTPAGVVVDTSIVGRAPLRFLRAGVGDLVSNITAAEDWRLAERAQGEVVDELAESIALLSARSVLDIEWPPNGTDIATIARGLVMSGLAMEIAGSSRPCSGAEHLVSHALDELTSSPTSLHGEQVAIGTLLAAAAHDLPARDHIGSLFTRMGWPSRPSQWGWSRDDLIAATVHAPSTRKGRYTVLDELEGMSRTPASLVDELFDADHAR